jgi:carboxylesterase type B
MQFALAISNYAQNVFMYRFSKKSDWLAPILGEENSLIRMNAVPHAIDIPYIFHLPGRKPLVPAIDRDREDDLISRWIVDYYTSFAHNATEEGMQDHRFPIAVSPVSVPPLLNVTWRKFEEKFQYYVDIDDRIELKQNLRAEECKLWDRLMPDYLVKSMSSRQTGKDERAAYQF